jgi:Arc/MetJ-type ribon-helix-helix transcriptional regulator
LTGDYESVIIPKRLYEKISEKIQNTSFTSVSEYIKYILEKELHEVDEEDLSEEDEKKIKERLRRLGYL